MNAFAGLLRKIEAEIARRMQNMALVGFVSGSADEIAMQYRQEVGYLKALADVVAMCDDVEREQNQ